MTQDSEWLSPPEEHLWRSWLGVHADLSAALQRHMQAGSQLSMADYGVLVHLTEEPGEPGGRMRASDLAGVMQWDASRLSHHVTRMQRRGLVERVECPEDRRGSYVAVTTAGREAIAQAAPDHVDAVRRHFLAGLDEGDVEVLTALLGKVRARLDDLA